jgi:hypothetical protein
VSLATDVLGLDTGEPEVAAAVIAAASALLLTGLKALAWLISGPRDRRRDLYGQAYQDAMAWLEMLYRVRRRANDRDSERALVERFHSLQKGIDHHRGWLGSESKYLARSYCRFVDAVKRETQELMQEAWALPGREPGEPPPSDEQHPTVETYSLEFLADVRSHLSLWPVIPWMRLAWRNRDRKNRALPSSGEASRRRRQYHDP